MAKKPVSLAPLDQESFIGRNLGHMRRSGYSWMKVSYLCAVSEPPCSSQAGWGEGGTVVIGRRALSACDPSLKPAFMRGVTLLILEFVMAVKTLCLGPKSSPYIQKGQYGGPYNILGGSNSFVTSFYRNISGVKYSI